MKCGVSIVYSSAPLGDYLVVIAKREPDLSVTKEQIILSRVNVVRRHMCDSHQLCPLSCFANISLKTAPSNTLATSHIWLFIFQLIKMKYKVNFTSPVS